MSRNIPMIHIIRFCTLILISLIISNVAISVFAQSDSTVTICHYPPGNTDNPQTITVNESALDSHLEHGDSHGSCPEPAEDPEPTEDTETTEDPEPTVAPESTEDPEPTVEATSPPVNTTNNNSGSRSSGNSSSNNNNQTSQPQITEEPEPTPEVEEIIYTGQISGTVWLEDMNWGVYDTEESGLRGTRVELINGGGALVRWRIVNRDGFYSFDGLEGGNYTVRIVRNSLRSNRLFQTYDLDNNLDLATSITLAYGEIVTDVNFGFAGDR